MYWYSTLLTHLVGCNNIFQSSNSEHLKLLILYTYKRSLHWIIYSSQQRRQIRDLYDIQVPSRLSRNKRIEILSDVTENRTDQSLHLYWVEDGVYKIVLRDQDQLA